MVFARLAVYEWQIVVSRVGLEVFSILWGYSLGSSVWSAAVGPGRRRGRAGWRNGPGERMRCRGMGWLAWRRARHVSRWCAKESLILRPRVFSAQTGGPTVCVVSLTEMSSRSDLMTVTSRLRGVSFLDYAEAGIKMKILLSVHQEF